MADPAQVAPELVVALDALEPVAGAIGGEPVGEHCWLAGQPLGVEDAVALAERPGGPLLCEHEGR